MADGLISASLLLTPGRTILVLRIHPRFLYPKIVRFYIRLRRIVWNGGNSTYTVHAISADDPTFLDAVIGSEKWTHVIYIAEDELCMWAPFCTATTGGKMEQACARGQPVSF